MSDKEDYYSLLGVDKSASDQEIKKAYRRLAMKYHPDRNKGDKNSEDKFKKISEAYEILSDKSKRQAYDSYGHAGVDPSAGMHGAAGAGGFGDIFNDIFGDIFGGGGATSGRRSRSRAQHGADLSYSLDLPLEDAALGKEVKIKFRTRVGCGSCKGSGAKDGAKPSACGTCGGHGQVRMQQGPFSIQQTCPNCHGQGSMIKDHCRSCSGSGLVPEEKNLSVKVPAGVDDGDRIRLAGEGEAGTHGGPAGDLYVQINVLSHKIFQREGVHLICELPISFITASLGGEIEVPTLTGAVKLKIPAETQTGKLFRLRNKGVKSVRGEGPGDMLCRVLVETPVSLNGKQKDILKQLDSSLQDNVQKHMPKTRAWLNVVKGFFENMR